MLKQFHWQGVQSWTGHNSDTGYPKWLLPQYTGTHFTKLERMTAESTPSGVNSMADRGSNSEPLDPKPATLTAKPTPGFSKITDMVDFYRLPFSARMMCPKY